MSLHIESTENALAELKKQRTKTLTAAISVSFLGIALMGLLLYLVHIIDDTVGRTICSASTADASIADPSKLANCATATKVGNLIGERAKAANVTEVVFDRGGFKFCGKVKALADAARETGLKF